MKASAAAILVAVLLFPALGQRREGESRGTPGAFDYYVLALSWSPEHCASPAGRNDRTQCGERRYAFVVHGLWPQYERGWPQFCSTNGRVSPALVDKMLDLMPSRGLIQHEYAKHGTCADGNPAAYFDTIRRAYNSIRIPAAFRHVDDYLTIEPAQIESRFLSENPSLKPEGISMVCRGRYLQEVRICLDKNLKPRPCGRDVPEACAVEKAVLRPSR